MSEIQRLVWLLSRPACSEVNLAMQDLLDILYQTSEQHKEIPESRQEKDQADSTVLMSFLSERNPFKDDHKLHNIVTGVVAERAVNAPDAKDVGNNIILSLHGKNIMQHSFRKKEHIVTMASQNVIKIRDAMIPLDPQLLFQRLVTAGMRQERMGEVFTYELCSYPPSMFENRHSLLPADKSALAEALWKLMPMETPLLVGDINFVLDGVALLHRVPWQRNSTYEEICWQYCKYVERHYGHPSVVFDGYSAGPSTKDAVHWRRAGGQIGPSMNITPAMVFNGKKKHFLRNNDNKKMFIIMLSKNLEKAGSHIHNAVGDADFLITQTVIAVARTSTSATILVGDDTDLLILLCHHVPSDMTNVYFRPESRHMSRRSPRCWNIVALKLALGPEVCNSILFAHAILACDSTSRLYGLGKGMAIKLLCNNTHFQIAANVFSNPDATPANVIMAGENSIALLYNGCLGDRLDSLRLPRFYRKVGSSTAHVQPRTHPPTSAAAKFHSFRVYMQVQQLMGNDLEPEKWGRFIQNGT